MEKDKAAGEPNRTLAPAQLAGLRYYKDLGERIPRWEVRGTRVRYVQCWHSKRPPLTLPAQVEALFEFVRKYAEQVSPGCELQVAGSYRRGAPHSGAFPCLAAAECAFAAVHATLTRARIFCSALQVTWTFCCRTGTKSKGRIC